MSLSLELVGRALSKEAAEAEVCTTLPFGTLFMVELSADDFAAGTCDPNVGTGAAGAAATVAGFSTCLDFDGGRPTFLFSVGGPNAPAPVAEGALLVDLDLGGGSGGAGVFILEPAFVFLTAAFSGFRFAAFASFVSTALVVESLSAPPERNREDDARGRRMLLVPLAEVGPSVFGVLLPPDATEESSGCMGIAPAFN